MKIYIVTSGEYSDYGILAAFLDKSKAEAFAQKYNRGVDYDPDRAEIEEYEEGMPFDFNSNDIYEVLFHEGTDKAPDVTLTELNDSFGYQNIPRVIAPPSSYVSSWSHLVTVAAKDADHALKIACDYLAKWKAEKEGL